MCVTLEKRYIFMPISLTHASVFFLSFCLSYIFSPRLVRCIIIRFTCAGRRGDAAPMLRRCGKSAPRRRCNEPRPEHIICILLLLLWYSHLLVSCYPLYPTPHFHHHHRRRTRIHLLWLHSLCCLRKILNFSDFPVSRFTYSSKTSSAASDIIKS